MDPYSLSYSLKIWTVPGTLCFTIGGSVGPRSPPTIVGTMKVRKLDLKYFKKHRDLALDFTDPETGLAQDLIVLVGHNGSGKSSVLQAIAATLGTATSRLKQPTDLVWPGLEPALIDQNWGRFPASVSLEVQFSRSETAAVHECWRHLVEQGKDLGEPAANEVVQLTWQGDRVQAPSAAELWQFKGRSYAVQLKQRPEDLAKTGTILWYDEQRTATSLTAQDSETNLNLTIDLLRDRLSKWQGFNQRLESGQYQLKLGQRDLYEALKGYYAQVFPGHHFEGPVPRDGVDSILSEPWFYLYDGQRQYELAEMSAGERAIFPILMDFANWNVCNSVILIDELELHLHPPLQQALLRVLPKLGENNQFIITTHSDYLANLVPESQIQRLG